MILEETVHRIEAGCEKHFFERSTLLGRSLHKNKCFGLVPKKSWVPSKSQRKCIPQSKCHHGKSLVSGCCLSHLRRHGTEGRACEKELNLQAELLGRRTASLPNASWQALVSRNSFPTEYVLLKLILKKITDSLLLSEDSFLQGFSRWSWQAIGRVSRRLWERGEKDPDCISGSSGHCI